ncbi:MAG: sulfatase-like hydrolase/transferase [Pirellulaceae bacterium]|nr:sulfatase-like hydrolase/transferase [Pirellulaceae bacterium]
MMNVRVALTLMLALFGVLFSRAATAQDGRPPRPNILFIYADDHSPKTVGCYEGAYPMARTPNIDRLAASGVRFRASYLGSWCMPSRASLLTGLHPHAIESMRMTGANPQSTYDPEQCRFWPAAFRRHGYQTAQIGKWHTGTDTGWGRDWDFQIVWNRPDNPQNATKYYGPQVLDVHGERQTVEGYSTDNYTRWACDYIRGEGRDADKPWYLWLCYGAIHGPTTPAERHKGLLKTETAELPAGMFGPRPGKPRYLNKTQAWERTTDGQAVLKGSKKTHTAWLQQVNECMMAVDEGVGEVIKALRESGQLGSTLVVYSSDQGFANGEHGLKQKVAPYEASYSSPFIVSMPGTLPAGKFCRHTVNAPDVVVTFFALAGLETPWKMHGRDFTSLLLDPENASWDRPTLFEHVGQEYGSTVTQTLVNKTPTNHAGVPYYAALRHEDWKYVRYLAGDEPEELYDLKTDPDELTNLAGDARYRATLEKFRGQWVQELQMADATFLEHVAPPTVR